MKTMLACALLIAPSGALAQVQAGGGPSAEALTHSLNTLPRSAMPAAASMPVQTVAAASVESLTQSLNRAPATQPAPANQAAEAPAVVSPEELTRALNLSGPRPVVNPAPTPDPAPVAAPAPAEVTPASQTVAPRSSLLGRLSRRTSSAPAAKPEPAPVAVPEPSPVPVPVPMPMSAPAKQAEPVAPPAAEARPRQLPAPVPAPSAAPVTRPVPAADAPAPAPPPTTTPADPIVRRPQAPQPGVLNAQAISSLPFEIDLPQGVQLAAVSTVPNARVWAVRKGPKTLAMIFAGTESQFPIYEGEQMTVAGRTSVVLTEGMRRIAMEHLFQRAAAPQELHIWVMAQDGADRDLAERIAQTLDYR